MLNGTATPNGQATTAYFQWGTTTAYGTATPSQSVGSGTTPVSLTATLAALSPATTYHYRLVATNGAGTTNGNDTVFTTSAPGNGLAITSIDPSSVVGSTFTLIVNGYGFDGAEAVAEIYQPNGTFMGNGTVTSRTSTQLVTTHGTVTSRTTIQLVTTQSMAGAAPGTYTVKVKTPMGSGRMAFR